MLESSIFLDLCHLKIRESNCKRNQMSNWIFCIRKSWMRQLNPHVTSLSMLRAMLQWNSMICREETFQHIFQRKQWNHWKIARRKHRKAEATSFPSKRGLAQTVRGDSSAWVSRWLLIFRFSRKTFPISKDGKINQPPSGPLKFATMRAISVSSSKASFKTSSCVACRCSRSPRDFPFAALLHVSILDGHGGKISNLSLLCCWFYFPLASSLCCRRQ